MRRVTIAHRLQKRLHSCSRRPQAATLALNVWRRLKWAIARRQRDPPSPRLSRGGLLIGIVGGDGAGKSTAIGALRDWLGQELETTQVHMGRPPWSLLTILVRGNLKIGKLLGLWAFMRIPLSATVEGEPVRFVGYPCLIREVCTARDRYLAYTRARRRATAGAIVLCDRFPLAAVELMDGPQCARLTRACRDNPFVKFLIRLEEHYYRPILEPDLLIVIKVNPDTAVQRRQEEDPVYVRARSTEIWRLDRHALAARVVDGGRPLAELQSELRALVWSRL